jgi:hypothetical protein
MKILLIKRIINCETITKSTKIILKITFREISLRLISSASLRNFKHFLKCTTVSMREINGRNVEIIENITLPMDDMSKWKTIKMRFAKKFTTKYAKKMLKNVLKSFVSRFAFIIIIFARKILPVVARLLGRHRTKVITKLQKGSFCSKCPLLRQLSLLKLEKYFIKIKIAL